MRTMPATEPLLDVLAVLDAAAARDEWPDAEAVVAAAKRSGATVHGILDKLEETGWLTGEWHERGTDRRRCYRLTRHGATQARDLLATHRPEDARAAFEASR